MIESYFLDRHANKVLKHHYRYESGKYTVQTPPKYLEINEGNRNKWKKIIKDQKKNHIKSKNGYKKLRYNN